VKVLWLTERFPPDAGGAAISCARQVAALAPRLERLDVLRLTSRLPAGQVAMTERDGFSLFEVGRAAEGDESLQLLQQVALNLVEARGHDLLHGFYAVPSGYVAALTARLARRPAVVSLRGNDVDRALFHGPRLAQLEWTLVYADALVGVSRAIFEKVRALTGRERGLHVVANAVDAALFTPEGERAVPEGAGDAPRPWIAFSGELRLKKGLPVLQELAVALAARSSGTLFWIGDVRREERAGVEAWRRAHPPAARRVRALSYVGDPARLAALCRSMDLFVFPSLWDGLPNALLEAMACAKPSVAAAVGAIPEVLEHDVSGRLVSPARLDTFAGEVLALADRPATEREQMGAAARAHVLAAHSIEGERDAHLALWAALLRGPAA
jgi:phosphatidylinositol alpha-1,6-mannosyltransferase